MALPKIGTLVRELETGIYYEVNDIVPPEKHHEHRLYVLTRGDRIKVKNLEELRREYRGVPQGQPL